MIVSRDGDSLMLREMSGGTDMTGTPSPNAVRGSGSALSSSEQRADAVVRYLVDKHDVPLRRIVTPFGLALPIPLRSIRPVRDARKTAAWK